MTAARIFFASLALVTSTSGAVAQVDRTLWDVAEVRDGMIELGAAYEITETCASAVVRNLRSIRVLLDLQRKAKAAGFSRSEIDDFLNDAQHKITLRDIVWDRLERRGATKSNPRSVCDAGQTEINEETLAGFLIRIRG